MTNTVEITEEYLTRQATAKIGWNRAQLSVLGVSWPPVKGWKQSVIGKTLTEAEAVKFEQARTKTKKKDDLKARECEFCMEHYEASLDMYAIVVNLNLFNDKYQHLLSKEESKALSTAIKKTELIEESLNEFIRANS